MVLLPGFRDMSQYCSQVLLTLLIPANTKLIIHMLAYNASIWGPAKNLYKKQLQVFFLDPGKTSER